MQPLANLRLFIVSMILLMLASSSQAQVIPPGGQFIPAIPLAGGGAPITNVALNQNGTVTISGTYFTNQGWAPQYIHVYFSENLVAGNKVVFMDVGNVAVGTWSVTTPAVPAGAYVAWVMFGIKNGQDTQVVTDPLKNINAPGPGGAIPAAVNTVTWGAVARNAGQQLVGNGNWAKAANWNFGSTRMLCLLAAGGVVDDANINIAGNGTWSATSNYAFAPNDFYNVVPVAYVSTGALSEITCGDVKLNK